MAKMTKGSPSRTPAKGYTIGRQGFSKISAVEGVKLTKGMDRDFRDFDRKGHSANKRRELISKKYGKDS